MNPSPAKNVSLRGGAGADKNEGGGWGGTSPPKKCQSEGGPADKNEGGGVGRDPSPQKCQSEGGRGLTFPNVKNDAGASTKAQKSPCFFFFGESVPAGAQLCEGIPRRPSIPDVCRCAAVFFLFNTPRHPPSALSLFGSEENGLLDKIPSW